MPGVARDNDCAMRVGVNCGSVDPAKKEKYPADDAVGPMLESALDHCEHLDSLGFTRYCVSLKDSDPKHVIDANTRFAEARPDVPLHLGVTEAGIPPEGVIKTRIAFEQLISRGIGDTLRVSLTVPNSRKFEEIEAGRQIVADIHAGRTRSVVGLRSADDEHHQLPELQPRRERGFRRPGRAGQGDERSTPATTRSRSR